MIDKRWQFWIGVILGIIIISLEGIPVMVLMVLGGFIAGFIVGSGKEGAKAGFLVGIIGIIIRTNGSIFSPTSVHPISNYLLGILDLVLIVVIPVVILAVIGGWIRQLVNKQAESVNYMTKES